jgi:D-ribulokinase
MGGGWGRGGAVDPRRRLALILGTSACCMAVSDQARFIDGVWGPYHSALLPGWWLTEGGQSAFGAAIDRLLRMHPAFEPLKQEAGDGVFDRIEHDILRRAGSLSAAAGLARDLHVLPDLIGNRSPLADPGVRGAVVGLDLRDDHGSLLQFHVATLCGLAYGLAQIVSTLEAAGYDFDTLVVSGGAGRSPLVRQIIADATGKCIGVPTTPEPVLLGSAMLGAVAAGDHDLRSAMGAMSGLGERHEPAGGAEVTRLHAAKSKAYGILQRTEGGLREVMASVDRSSD